MRTSRSSILRRTLLSVCVCGLFLATVPAVASAASVSYNRSLPILGGDCFTDSCFILNSGTAIKTILNYSDPSARKVRFTPCNESGSEINGGIEIFPGTAKRTIFTHNGTNPRHVRIKMETVSRYVNHTIIDGTWYWTGSRHLVD